MILMIHQWQREITALWSFRKSAVLKNKLLLHYIIIIIINIIIIITFMWDLKPIKLDQIYICFMLQ